MCHDVQPVYSIQLAFLPSPDNTVYTLKVSPILQK